MSKRSEEEKKNWHQICCQLLVGFFRKHVEEEDKGQPKGLHSRIFQYVLHPEKDYVYYGASESASEDAPNHPEHVVPCAVLISECCRLVREKKTDDEIVPLLMKHWKIVAITKDEQGRLDNKHGLNLKSSMPKGWSFETGDTFERLVEAEIKVIPGKKAKLK